MEIFVDDNRLKIYHAKYGYNKLFGNDVDTRKQMSDPELIERFDDVWSRDLRPAVMTAERCDIEDARRKLKPDQQIYVKEDEEQREFWLEGGLFVAQLKSLGEAKELTQLWFIRSSNVDPRTLFITFETLALREQFSKLANSLGWRDVELGEKLLIDFMETGNSTEKTSKEVDL